MPSPTHSLTLPLQSLVRSDALRLLAAVALGLVLLIHPAFAASIPGVGDKAPDFTLKGLDGAPIRFDSLTKQGTVVLVVLRGWPGYQCPICDRQVQDFIGTREQFAAAGAQLVFIYPGPAADLQAHAEEFKAWKGKEWPSTYLYLLDPDYAFTNAYGLRWDAPRETAYPSTFIIAGGTVKFVKISHSHGDRTKATDILAALKQLPAGM